MLYTDTAAASHTEPDLDRCLELIKVNDMGTLVGYTPIYERNDKGDRTGKILGYRLYGTNGLLEIDPLLNAYRASSIWGWSDPFWPKP